MLDRVQELHNKPNCQISADSMKYYTSPTRQCYSLQKELRFFFWTGYEFLAEKYLI